MIPARRLSEGVPHEHQTGSARSGADRATEPPAAPPKAQRPKSFTDALQAFTAEHRKTGWWISRPWPASAAEKPQWSGPFAKTYSFPGNPDINSNLNKPNAPIPTHGNLQWVSTIGMEAYDTPSGDLEGDYAQEADGSYISNVPAYTYTDATSSVPIAAHIATSKTDPTLAAQ